MVERQRPTPGDARMDPLGDLIDRFVTEHPEARNWATQTASAQQERDRAHLAPAVVAPPIAQYSRTA